MEAASARGQGAPAGRLVGVGVGPGDPELLTLKAQRALREADRVVAPTLAVDAAGRAETIVREALPGLRCERLVFEMSYRADRSGARAEATERLLGWLDRGERVAFVTLGDPNIYSTFASVASELRERRPEVEVATVPGIMAFQALASRASTVLLEGTQALSLVTALDGTAALEDALSRPENAIVVYKGGKHLPAISDALARAGRLEGAVMGELLGLPGERAGPLSDACDSPATYLATVIVPPRVEATTKAGRCSDPGDCSDEGAAESERPSKKEVR